MSKTTAPLLSFGATGQIGKTMVFASWRGIPYARRYVIPANPQTTAQQLTRTTFAMLREMWKLNGTIGRAPWDAFATGRSFLGLNSFIGENLRVLRAEATMNNFIGSPGARGGLPPVSVVATTGAGSGEIVVTVTEPTIPPGWTLTGGQAGGFPDQDPSLDFGGPLVEGEDLVTPFAITLGGLGSAVACQGTGWLKWLKPNAEVAYSVGITDQATSGV